MIKKQALRYYDQIKNIVIENKNLSILGSVAILFILSLYGYSILQDQKVTVFKMEKQINFQGGRILNQPHDLYGRKEKVYESQIKNMTSQIKDLTELTQHMSKQLKAYQEVSKNSPPPYPPKQEDPTPSNEVQFSQGANLKIGKIPLTHGSTIKRLGTPKKKRLRSSSGPSLISFPVQAKAKKDPMGVKIPAGSFVKAKLLTGVEAPEGKALPVLLQADYAFVGPNKSRVDLAGCFLIAKSSGNLSIERVEMQATKISCVSKSGRMFEKGLNGFVADAKDNSFAVLGRVNSKQDRVASMAFLSSIVEGVGKAIQQAQTTNQTNALGGNSSMITGDQGKYIAAGGVGSAASMVTNWYLKHAQNLLPTINVGSGQDVWIVIQDSVDLPNWYFRTPKENKSHYSVYSRLIE